MNYAEISPEIINSLYHAYEQLKDSPLDQSLRVLIELRVSQLNECNYCCKLHAQEAQKLFINGDKINELTSWQTSLLFTAAEKEALTWAESLTKLESEYDVLATKLSNYFTEREIVDLTACIAIMNALNRMTRLTPHATCELIKNYSIT